MEHLGRLRRDGAIRFVAVISLIAASCLLIHLVLGQAALVSNPDAIDIFLTMAFDSSKSAGNQGIAAMAFDPRLLAGYSHWLNANYSPFYPLFFNWLGTDQTSFDTLLRLELVVRLHMLILAAGGYWFARELGAGRWAAWFCALVLPWMPAVQTTFGWPHIIASLAWIPWVLAAQIRIARAERFDAIATLALAASTILLFYAQPAQNLVLAVIASFIIWAVPLRRLMKDRGDRSDVRHPTTVMLSLAFAGALVLVVCGYYLGRLLVFQTESIRWLGAFGEIVGTKRVPMKALREFAVSPRDMISALSFKPEYSGQPGNLFAGIPLVIISAYGFAHTKDAFVKATGAIALLGLILCCRLIVPIAYWIPLVNKIRELGWWSCLWVIALLPLAAKGLTVLAAHARAGQFSRGLALKLAGTVIVVVAFVAVVDRSISFIGLVLNLAIVLMFALLTGPERPRRLAIVCAAPLLAAVTFAPAAYVLPHSSVENSYYFRPRNIELREQARELARTVPPEAMNLYRASVDVKLPEFKVLTHMLANEGLRMIRGDIHPQLYRKFQLLYFPNLLVQKLYGVRYTAKVDGADGSKMSWETLDGARPRIYFRTARPTPVANPADAISKEVGEDAIRDFVSTRTGVDPALAQLPEVAPGFIPVQILENTDTRMRVVVKAESAGMLVLNEDVEGGWLAHINHVSRKPFAVNGFQSGFVIEKAGIYEILIEGGR